MSNRKRTRLIRERMDRTGEPYTVAARTVDQEYKESTAAAEAGEGYDPSKLANRAKRSA